MNTDNSNILKASEIVKIYKRRKVVDDVSISLRQGEVVGLLGPNGAGKTTSFYIIIGLIRPESGQVFLNDTDITHYPMFQRARMGISYLPQETSIFRKLSVRDNIMMILETLPLTNEERHDRLQVLLRELSIEHLSDSMAYTLSGGERRRVEITRALVLSPSFILLDEPFAGIDPIAVGDIQQIVLKLKQRGIGILITDHNVRETLKITDKAYIINEGRILKCGTPDEIASSESVRKFYLGEGFIMDKTVNGALP